jgi:hypothetical protein
MFLSFSDSVLKEVEATKDQMNTKALAIEEVGCMFKMWIRFISFCFFTL